MDKLLELLKSLFKDLDTVQALLGKLAETFLKDVPEPKGCKDAVLRWLKAGTLDEEFEKDPFCVVVCLAYTALAVAIKVHGHDHDHPDVILTAEPDTYFAELGEALKVPAPVTGPLSNLLLELILSELVKILKEKLDEWLNTKA